MYTTATRTSRRFKSPIVSCEPEERAKPLANHRPWVPAGLQKPVAATIGDAFEDAVHAVQGRLAKTTSLAVTTLPEQSPVPKVGVSIQP